MSSVGMGMIVYYPYNAIGTTNFRYKTILSSLTKFIHYYSFLNAIVVFILFTGKIIIEKISPFVKF